MAADTQPTRMAAQAEPAQEQPAPIYINVPPISINMTFNGQAEANKVKAAVLEAGKRVQESFAEQMTRYKREEARAAYV